MEMSIYLLRNQFDNATKGNHKRMLIAATDHFNKLEKIANQDGNINTIYQTALPFFQYYINGYQQLTTNYHLYQAQTQLFEEKMVELRSILIRKWDIIIQYEYDITSAQYKMLLPNGRSTFQIGSYELRINAVSSLLANIQTMNNLNFTGLTQQITNWLQEIKQLRSKQKGNEVLDTTLRQNLEENRKVLANTMQLVFFQLCVYYHSNLKQVETFYNWSYFKGNLANKDKNIHHNIETKLNNNKIITHINDNDNNLTIKVEHTNNIPIELWIPTTQNSPNSPILVIFNNQAKENFAINNLNKKILAKKYLIDREMKASLKEDVMCLIE